VFIRGETLVVYHLLGKTGWSTVVVNGRVKTRLEISTGMHSFQLQDCSLKDGKAYFAQIVVKDHQHTRETKEEPYEAPKAHTLRTGTFAKPSFITLVVSRSKTIPAKRLGAGKNKQMEGAFSFGNSVWEFWTTFQEIPFSRGNFRSGRRK